MDYKKVPEQINNFINDNVQALAQLFPSAVKDGQVDFTALKEELGQFEDVDKEKYELTWAGKQDAKKKAQEDVFGRTLKYIEADSKNPDTTENLYIEGDNLEVLKLLRQNYYGAIKMIYIDPPYNTGNDFIYNDNFKMDAKESDIDEGIRDEKGISLQKNQKSTNRFHANWLNMMYPRLKVAKSFLDDNGVILISIGDDELSNLIAIMNEIYGEMNQICIFTWKSRAKPTNAGNSKFRPQKVAEYIVVYGKKTVEQYLFNVIPSKIRAYPHEDELGKYRTTTILTSNRGTFRRETMRFESNGFIPDEDFRWKAGKQTIDELFRTNHIRMNEDGIPLEKKYEHEEREPLYPIYCFVDNEISGTAEKGKSELNNIIGNNHGFDTVKPVQLIKYLIATFVGKQGIVMDFFSGTATTVQAVFEYNAENNSKIKSLCVQYAEEFDEESESKKAGFNTICDIGKRRIDKAGEMVVSSIVEKNEKYILDIGFKVFRTADTNIKWNMVDIEGQIDTDTVTNTPDLADFTLGFNDIDIVYEVMLRQKDVPLSETLETLENIGNRTYLYGSAYLVCLETEITEELIDKLAALDPLPIKFVFRDSAFKDDINLKDETFRRLKNLIERNSGLTKKTYTVEFI